MKVIDFLKTYNFHDSLLESFVYKEDSKELVFEIDFCYWAQNGFEEGSEENGMVNILFTGVTDFQFEEYELCSDSILSFDLNNTGRIEITVETDDGDVHTFSFMADSVEMSK